MKEHIYKVTKFDSRTARILLATAGIILAGAAGIWLLIKFWPAFLFVAACAGIIHLYRRARSGINITDGIRVTPDALSAYLRKVVRELEWDVNPELKVHGWGNNLVIRMKVDFPTEPSEAADFHSQVIYVQGYLARRLKDDFRILDARVEIDALKPSLVGARS